MVARRLVRIHKGSMKRRRERRLPSVAFCRELAAASAADRALTDSSNARGKNAAVVELTDVASDRVFVRVYQKGYIVSDFHPSGQDPARKR